MAVVSWDMPVLFGSLLAILISLVWSRATTVGPVIFAWVGAAAGGTVAFVRHFDKANDQVGIEYIVPSAALGAVFGLPLGLVVRATYLRSNVRCKLALEALAGASLTAAFAMLMGWNSHGFDDNALSSASWFAAAGAGIGAGLALLNCRLRKWSAHAESGAAPNHDGK